MVTVDVSVSNTWTKLADAADEAVVVSGTDGGVIRLACTDTDTAPTVAGHAVVLLLEQNTLLTRDQLGHGYLWARLDDARFPSVTLAVTR